ncbi:MAG: TPM domain-containing protein, partial [Sphingomonas sp.]|nr:TPM domain-containing protein [Sphingomonas sp.]
MKGRGIICALMAFLFFLAAPAFAQSFPALTGRIVDNAHLLAPEQAAALDAKLAQLEQQSGRQMVVATIPDLQGYPIEDYGYQLGRKWGLGDKKANDGLLLLVAPNERKVRIEVGYGLEPVMTDAMSSIIIRNDILPQFKSGDYDAG